MGEKEIELELLEKAKLDEEAYNWREAAKIYEEIANSLLDKKKLQQAAKNFMDLGRVYYLSSETANTRDEYTEDLKNAKKSYEKALSLFKQLGKHPEELECQAEIYYCKADLADSILHLRSSLVKASKIFTESSIVYSEINDIKGETRTSVKAAYIWSFLTLFYIPDKEDIKNYYEKGMKLAVKAINLSKGLGESQFIALSFFAKSIIVSSKIFLTDFKKDHSYKEIFKNLLAQNNDLLNKISDYNNDRILGLMLFITGNSYCLYGTHYLENEKEFLEYTNYGLELLEKSLEFFKKTKIKTFLIISIFYINWWALFARKFDYLQKRISKDFRKLEKLAKIYDGYPVIQRFYANFLPTFYYTYVSQRSFFSEEQRLKYTQKGIEKALMALDGLSALSHSAWAFQSLTYLYSQLIFLLKSKEAQKGYIKLMVDAAEGAMNSGELYGGGMMMASGFSSKYRAYKTLAEISLEDDKKIEYLSVAAEALKNYLEHTPESLRLILISKIRLALLHEEIGITKQDKHALIESKQLLHEIADESTMRGYQSYTAASYEFIARIEDRLGNYSSASEHYLKAKEYYLNSINDIRYRQLKERIKEKVDYAQAWSFIESAKFNHKHENHMKAKKNYETACKILKDISKRSYEATYFSAWVLLEESEYLSKQEKHRDAIDRYKGSSEKFETAYQLLNDIFTQSKDKLEKNRIKKLYALAKVRINYCDARAELENARILGKKGKHSEAAEIFASAANKFKFICTKHKIDRERKDLEAVYYLCKAWENMEIAELSGDPERFAEAAELFTKSSNLFDENKLKTLSLGNSAFCQALALGKEFDNSIETEIKAQIYPKIKLMIRNATTSYRKGGFKNAADWAFATSTYFDAAWHLIQADVSLDLEEKRKLLRIGAELLESTAELFADSGYENKKREILLELDMIKKEEKVIFSALDTIREPAITKSTVGIIAPACPLETSQSPKISEVREYGEATQIDEATLPKEKYKIVYKDLLKDTSKIEQPEFRVGVAQIGISNTGDLMKEFYEEKASGLIGLRADKINDVINKTREMVEQASDIGVNILVFPEMAIDLNYTSILEQISDLAEKYKMYIIPGSYHDEGTKRNVCMVIGPDGIHWEQEKHIPAMIHFGEERFKEGIEVSKYPRTTYVCNTEFGRIAILICRDFLDMDLRVELKNFEPPVDLIFNPAFTPVTADFKAAHFDARRSLYAYCFFTNIAEFGDSFIYTPEKERTERNLAPKEEGLIYKDVDLFKLRSERKKWEKIKEKERRFIQSTR